MIRYDTFGALVADDILNSYPKDSQLVGVARAMIAVVVTLCYPLQSHPSRGSALVVLSTWHGTVRVSVVVLSTWHGTVRVGVVVLSTWHGTVRVSVVVLSTWHGTVRVSESSCRVYRHPRSAVRYSRAARWLPYTAAALYGRCITSLLRVASAALGAPGIFTGENEPRTHFGVAIGFVLASTAIALTVEVSNALYGK